MLLVQIPRQILNRDMRSVNMGSSLEDIEFLARSAHRVTVLDALALGPQQRGELRDETGASDPTIGRILGDFEARGWVRRDGHEYVLTHPGAFVAEHFASLLERMSTERRLRDVWRLLPSTLPGFDLDLLSDAVVTTIKPGDPYAPANRCASFYPTTDRVRGFDAALTAPHTYESLAELVHGGLDAEFVIPPGLSANLQASYPEAHRAVTASDNLTSWWNDDLPLCRVVVFDDRVGVGGYDPDSGVLAVYVDTDAPELREWAVSTFERFRSEARPAYEEQTT